MAGKDLPTELRAPAIAMRADLPFDAAQVDPLTSVDYEYSRAGIRDPKIVVTTSRDPSSKLLQFAKVSSFSIRHIAGDVVLGRSNAGV